MSVVVSHFNVCTSLITHAVERFFKKLICHLSIFFGEVKVVDPFLIGLFAFLSLSFSC